MIILSLNPLVLVLVLGGSEHLRRGGSLLDEPLAEFPQAEGGCGVLGLRGGQASEAVVEVHPTDTLQLWSHSAIDCSGRSLLLWKQTLTMSECWALLEKLGDALSKGQAIPKTSLTIGNLLLVPSWNWWCDWGNCFTACQKDTMGQTVSLFEWSSSCTCTSDTCLSTICMLSYRYLPNTSLETTGMSWLEVFNSGKFYKSF